MRTQDPAQYLLLGVGGMGMAPLACWMSRAGYSVTGYDACLQEGVRRHLLASGVELQDFVFPEHLSRFTTVVYSSAIRPGHPLLDAAHAAGMECLRRGEMLARLAADYKLIAVVGSHGKTTTTGMIAYGIQRCGISANYLMGGLFADDSLGPSHYAASSRWMVAEIDESDGTIEGFVPEHTLVLNLDWDHADRYKHADQLEATFRELTHRTRQKVFLPAGLALDGLDESKVARFPSAAGAQFNQANASAAWAILRCLMEECPPRQAKDLNQQALANFPGVVRRQGVLYDANGLTLVEDYAHHPTEIEALIQNLRARADGRQLLVVFQPHRYSRTRQFKQDFAAILSQSDGCYLLPVYAAHEGVIESGELKDLVDAFDDFQPTVLEFGLSGIQQVIQAARAKPTMLAFVGAGDIEDFADAGAALLREPLCMDAACLDFLRHRLSSNAIVKTKEPLANKTTMRIGGAARLYAEPAGLADLQQLLKMTTLFGLDYFCLGRGSNLLVADAGYDGLVIRFTASLWRKSEPLGPGQIWAAAGVRLKEICGLAAKAGMAGFEFLEGIPGSVGGALRMNAGAMGSWMFDVVERVQFLDERGNYQDWPKERFHFGYRQVLEISRGIALGAVLKSAEVEQEACIRNRIDSYSTTRKESQPRGPSAGCIFKNPAGSYAGKLIDEFGLKGLQVGAAEVSDVHGNFIVNLGGATAADVIELIRRIRAKVKVESGYDLEPEVLLLGASWSEVLQEGGEDV